MVLITHWRALAAGRGRALFRRRVGPGIWRNCAAELGAN